jgi:hypothetical protein
MLPALSAPPGDLYWRESVPALTGHKMLLRTVGNVAIVGKWTGTLGQYYTAWCPLPRHARPDDTGH